MSSALTIVMYHYVRDLSKTRYPAIKALSVEGFRAQLAYLNRHYQIVTMESVLDALADHAKPLPSRPALLTFDDGYTDHFTDVFPILDELGLQGSFFPPARPILESRVLSVNKIHFVLASVSNASDLLQEVVAEIDARVGRFGLRPGAEYWARFDEMSRYDSREVTFIKRLLQKGLPEAVREEIVDELFRRHVTNDESAFAHELYMSLDDLRHMHSDGMFIGSHGYSHVWLNAVDRQKQIQEVSRSLEFLRMIDPAMRRWVMCYPYGGYDASIIAVLRQYGCAAGLGVDVGIADIEASDPYKLPRLDTNDLPQEPNMPFSPWEAATPGRST